MAWLPTTKMPGSSVIVVAARSTCASSPRFTPAPGVGLAESLQDLLPFFVREHAREGRVLTEFSGSWGAGGGDVQDTFHRAAKHTVPLIEPSLRPTTPDGSHVVV